MTYQLRHHSEVNIYEIRFLERVTNDDIVSATSESIQLEKNQGIDRFLVDSTGSEFSFSYPDLYEVITRQYVEEDADRYAKVGVVLHNSQREDDLLKFYERVSRSKGLLVKAFMNRREAIEWLTESND